MSDIDPNILSLHLAGMYGDLSHELAARMARRLSVFTSRYTPPAPQPLDEKDVLLITYPDQFLSPGTIPLENLFEFCSSRIGGILTGVHVLPFFPSSSDDGFSILDYCRVDPAYGNWRNIRRLAGEFRLMVDGVVNHVSAQSEWFRRFLAGDPEVRDFFILPDSESDLSAVVRPRTSPLLTAFKTAGGRRSVWTTFSPDQVDLNFAQPEVFFRILDVLLFYVSQGASIIRLDAIAYLWKQPGTPCIHLPQVHAFVRLLRAALEMVAPHVFIITETNVPHVDNISYFGNGSDEAHLVYNFSLPPLLLHSLAVGSAVDLSQWAAALRVPSPGCAFVNFLASHDGIGLNPLRDILTDGQIDALVQRVQSLGGLVSSKSSPSGASQPYELNINFLDALASPAEKPDSFQIPRFLAAHACLFALAGLPAIYVHSLLGSNGWLEGVRSSGHNRTINHQKFELPVLNRELDDHSSTRSRVFRSLAAMLSARRSRPAFHPNSAQCILTLHPAVFSILRTPQTGFPILCLHNLSTTTAPVPLKNALKGLQKGTWTDILTGERFPLGDLSILPLSACQVLWLSPV